MQDIRFSKRWTFR